MRSRAQALVFGVILVLAVAWIGCGGQQEQVNEAAEAEYAWLTENQARLSTLRQELADLRAQAEMEAEEAEGDEEDAVSGFDAALFAGLVDGYGQACGCHVAELFDVDEYPFGLDADLLDDGLEHAQIRLVRDQQVDVVERGAVGFE